MRLLHDSDFEHIDLQVRNLGLRIDNGYYPLGYKKVGDEFEDPKAIFSKVSFNIQSGSITAIMGAS